MMDIGDQISHGGKILDIFYNGKIDLNVNFYPLTHILAFSISSISNIGYIDSTKILSPIFSLLLPLYFYILAKELSDNRFLHNLTFLISSTFYFSSLYQYNSITVPMSLSLLMLPLLFFLFIKSMHHSSKIISFTVCLLLSFSAYVFFHPLTSLLLIFYFVLLYIIGKFTKMQLSHRGSLFFSVAVLAYIFYLTTVWIRHTHDIYYFFLGYDIPLGYLARLVEKFGILGLKGFDLAVFLFKTFGHQALLLFLSFFSVISILFGRIRKNSNVWFLQILVFMLASSTLFLVLLFFPRLSSTSSIRYSFCILLFTPLLSSLFLSTLRKRFIIIPILFFLFSTSLLVLYSSPFANKANNQVTQRNLFGSIWLLDNKKSDIGLSGYTGFGITRRMIGLLIPSNKFYYEEKILWYNEKSIMPDHLGYAQNSYIWDTLQEDRYLIISKYDLVVYPQVFRSLDILFLEDIDILKNDYTALFIYNNGEYLVFYISR